MRRVERLLSEARQLRILRATRVRQMGEGISGVEGVGDDGEVFAAHMRVGRRICSDLMEASDHADATTDVSERSEVSDSRRSGPVDVIDPALLAPVIDGLHAGFEAVLSPALRRELFDAFHLATTRRLHPGGVDALLAGRTGGPPGEGEAQAGSEEQGGSEEQREAVGVVAGNGRPRAGDRARRSALDDVVQLVFETCIHEALRRYCLEADARRAVSSYVDASDIEVAGDRVAKRRPVKPKPKTKGQLNAERSFGRFWKKREAPSEVPSGVQAESRGEAPGGPAS